MIKKRWIWVIASIFTVIFMIWGYSKYNVIHAQNQVLNYLTEVKKYNPSDIYSIETSISKAPVVSTEVIFKDEMDARYFYKVEDGKVIQFSQAPARGIDTEKYDYKHEESRKYY